MTQVTGQGSPPEGSLNALLKKSTGSAAREVDLTGRSGVHLTYWAKIDGFSGADTATVEVSTDGGGSFSTIKTFSLADSDGVYRSYDIDLSGFAMTSNFQIRFQTHASANQSKLYVDDVKLVD